MKIERVYRSFLLSLAEQNQRALAAFKQRCWEEPTEEDCLRDTAINRKRLEYVKRLADQGKIAG